MSVVFTFFTFLYVEKCQLSHGFIDLCIFDGSRGLPLPYYNSNDFYWTTLFIDLLFWLILTFLLYIIIVSIIKFVKIFIKK